jgi:hypothetical protein
MTPLVTDVVRGTANDERKRELVVSSMLSRPGLVWIVIVDFSLC